MESSPVHYPSLRSPSSGQPPPEPKSRLPYPNPSSPESVDLPVDAREDVLVRIPGAIVHLIDRQASVHLGSGDFSLVRLSQSGNGIAVFARVGEELQWPVTKDEASVKLDDCHYFFSLHVPPEIEKECRAAPEERGQATEASSTDDVLNYGVTFGPRSDAASLGQLDEVLKQYSFFTVPEVTQAETGKGIRNWPGKSNFEERSTPMPAAGSEKERMRENATPEEVLAEPGLKEAALEQGSAAYWTLLAPNVEDYTSTIPRAITAGAGHIIRGIFWCSEATIAQLEKGNLYMKGKLTPNETPTKISPSTMRRIRRVKKISAMSKQVAVSILSGVLKAAEFFTKPLITSKAGQKLLSLLPGQIALASLDGFGKIFDAVELAGKNVLTTTSTMTTGLVSQRYGDEAAQLTHEGFNTAGGFLTTAWTVSKLRKVFYPTSMVKGAAKVAGADQKARRLPANEEQAAVTKVHDS